MSKMQRLSRLVWGNSSESGEESTETLSYLSGYWRERNLPGRVSPLKDEKKVPSGQGCVTRQQTVVGQGPAWRGDLWVPLCWSAECFEDFQRCHQLS